MASAATGIIRPMTERGLPIQDGSPACPFVAFDDDRDSRSDRPDHRHRCFAETEPAPRALAHQEAYCLSSAFPVCPTFQAWARREAARAKVEQDDRAAERALAAGAADDGPRTGREARSSAAPVESTASATPADAAPEWIPGETAAAPDDEPDATPIESTPRRNPPRDWAAPPPWATGGIGSTAGDDRGSAGSPERRRPPEGQGLAGSAADLLARGGSLADPDRSPADPRPSGGTSRSASELPSSAPDPDLAGLVGGRPRRPSGGEPDPTDADLGDCDRAAASLPPPRGGRRPAVSSTRHDRDRDRPRAPQREHVQDHDGPSWEHSRRSEAYPVIRARPSIGLPSLPRVAVLAGALGIAAVALFFLPALLGIGGSDPTGSPSPSPTSTAATPTPEPTPEPAPTAQTYTIKTGDTLSRIARDFGITLDELLAANTETIVNPDRISVGDVIIIPVPPPDEIPGASSEASPAP